MYKCECTYATSGSCNVRQYVSAVTHQAKLVNLHVTNMYDDVQSAVMHYSNFSTLRHVKRSLVTVHYAWRHAKR
jgi:hypothetical protein